MNIPSSWLMNDRKPGYILQVQRLPVTHPLVYDMDLFLFTVGLHITSSAFFPFPVFFFSSYTHSLNCFNLFESNLTIDGDVCIPFYFKQVQTNVFDTLLV